MKYIVILGDGMADVPNPQLNNRTPLQAARKPYMDLLCRMGETGIVQTIPQGFPPGSDVANLSVMGYAPEQYYTGRSPLEAVSMGIDVAPSDTTFRANVVTLSSEEPYESKTMIDYSAGEIGTEEARALIHAVDEALGCEEFRFFGGISYRHLLLWHKQGRPFCLTPPHDITGKGIAAYLPDCPWILDVMKKSYDVLKAHPINLERVRRGQRPANSVWIWGQGTRPGLLPFQQKFGIKGAVISAVDLVKGLGICAGMDSIDVEGATGNYDTNFAGKAQAALQALETHDFVYVHMEAPDECGHHFDLQHKVESIESIDREVVGPIYEALMKKGEDFSILIMPDHPTPLNIGTHTSDPVPYAIFRSSGHKGCNLPYDEESAKGGAFVEQGHKLMDYFILNTK